MNTLVIVLIAAVCLIAAYALYGRWLAKKWGIDPNAKTPAVVHNDGQDYVPTDGLTVFAHQFSSIAGSGPGYRRHSGSRFRMASGASVDYPGRYLLRRCDRLRRAVRQREKRRKIHGTSDRKVHRKNRTETVSGILLAVLPDRYRGLRRHGGGHL